MAQQHQQQGSQKGFQDTDRASEAGRKGGESQSMDNTGNFANNPEKAREAGREGGSR